MSDQEAQKLKSPALSPLLVLFILGAAVLVVIIAALAFVNRDGGPDATAQANTDAPAIGGDLRSSGVNQLEPKPVTPFTLTRMDGTPLTLDDLKGRYSVLYFGYTYCPDFCPSTMTDWRLIRRGLGDTATRINFVMVSVDPERDTPEVLTQYLSTFDSAIIGTTGNDATIRKLADELGAFYEPVAHGDSPLYTVDHTASQFVLDPDGNFVAVYSFATPIDLIVADLREKVGG